MTTVDIHYIKAALKCLERKGISTSEVLLEIGITDAQLEQPLYRAHGDQITRLVQYVWRELEDEFMGCTEHPCKPGAFAFMAHHVLHYQSLNAILAQGIQFYNLFSNDIQMALVTKGEITTLHVVFTRPELDPDNFYKEFWLIIWHRFASWVVGKKIPLQQASFNFTKPRHLSELKYLFPCRQLFDQSSLKITFNTALLALPPIRSRGDLAYFLKHSPADLIAVPRDDKSYRANIRALLLNQKSDILHCPSFEKIAETFNTSAQTLRRRLKQEGTSYPRIKDDIRKDMAIEKLLAQKLSIANCSHSLGFKEPRSFMRAFKQWTGCTPTQYLILKESQKK